jgi:RNA polymerase sigma-70 factor (ECF subfamily)
MSVLPKPRLHGDEPYRSDDDLASAVRDGEGAALAALYRRYAHELMAVAYRLLLSRADAEDVLHDVFVGLPEALRRYEPRGALAGWLKRVTVRVALTRLRRARARREVALDVAPPVEGRSGEVNDTISLADAMAALPPALRAVVVLKEIEGYSHEEIAELLGISRGASEVRLHRAMRRLRARLEGGER